MRTTQAELQQVYPGEVETMVQGLKDAEKSFAALEQKKNSLFSDLESLQLKSKAAIQQAEATRAELARTPKPPSPADLARQRLAAMARRYGAENQTAHSPLLQDGPLLQSQAIGYPPTQTRCSNHPGQSNRQHLGELADDSLQCPVTK